MQLNWPAVFYLLLSVLALGLVVPEENEQTNKTAVGVRGRLAQ